MYKVLILYTEAGGGHKSTALALKEILQASTWNVLLFDPITDGCQQFDVMQQFLGLSSEKIYNRFVSGHRNSLLALILASIVFKINIFICGKKIEKCLAHIWEKTQADLVISVAPFINKVVVDSIDNVNTEIRFVTLPTDRAECVSNIWFVSAEQYALCGSEELVRQAQNAGIRSQHIYQLSGMLVAKKFYDALQMDKTRLRRDFKLEPATATGLVIFGSHGSPDMLTIAQAMNRTDFKHQLIFICGYNDKLKQQLASLQLDYRIVIIGFTNDVELYMRCADFIIGKAGGVSVAEAAVMQIPQIIKLNFFTLLQERANALWVKQQGIGILVKNFKRIAKVIKELLQSQEKYKTQLKMLNNQAYLEIPTSLQDIVRNKES